MLFVCFLLFGYWNLLFGGPARIATQSVAGGQGGIRTLKAYYRQRILSPPCIPFHHLPLKMLSHFNTQLPNYNHQRRNFLFCFLVIGNWILRRSRFWRPGGESNSCTRFCRPLPNRSDTWPSNDGIVDPCPRPKRFAYAMRAGNRPPPSAGSR